MNAPTDRVGDAEEAEPHGPTASTCPNGRSLRTSQANRRVRNEEYTTVGVDIAKNVVQLHWVDAGTSEIVKKQIKRAAFLEHFANREPCLIGMEACGGAPHWARRLMKMGHQVKLMPAKFVKAFNISNKNDPADARAIWIATQMSSKPVAVKTEAQQVVLVLHRLLRQQKIKFRTMQMNSLRGLLTEYGEVMAKSRAALDKTIPGVLARLAERLPAMLRGSQVVRPTASVS